MGAPLNNINQNWEKAILNKLSKIVSVREQHFTEEEKAQARENLGIEEGSGGADFFDAVYNVTSYADIRQAMSEGKTVRLIYDWGHPVKTIISVAPMLYYDENEICFGFWNGTTDFLSFWISEYGWVADPGIKYQFKINDLDTIRSGAAAGATAYQKPANGIPASDLADGVIPTVPVASAIPANGMKANVHYELGTLTGNVSITIDSTSEVAGMMNIYSLSFVADSTAPTITFPSSITGWAGNCLDNTTHGPVITAGKAYEFTLEGNLAVINQFEA